MSILSKGARKIYQKPEREIIASINKVFIKKQIEVKTKEKSCGNSEHLEIWACISSLKPRGRLRLKKNDVANVALRAAD